nr:MAG TPA: hypothetical protein [Caudoviricetes sp.]
MKLPRDGRDIFMARSGFFHPAPRPRREFSD